MASAAWRTQISSKWMFFSAGGVRVWYFPFCWAIRSLRDAAGIAGAGKSMLSWKWYPPEHCCIACIDKNSDKLQLFLWKNSLHIVTGVGVGGAGRIITKWLVNHASAVAFRKCRMKWGLIGKGRKCSTSNVKIAARCFLCSWDFLNFLIKVSHENMWTVDKKIICEGREDSIMPEIRLLLRQCFWMPLQSVCWWPTMNHWYHSSAGFPLPLLYRGLGGHTWHGEWC